MGVRLRPWASSQFQQSSHSAECFSVLLSEHAWSSRCFPDLLAPVFRVPSALCSCPFQRLGHCSKSRTPGGSPSWHCPECGGIHSDRFCSNSDSSSVRPSPSNSNGRAPGRIWRVLPGEKGCYPTDPALGLDDCPQLDSCLLSLAHN